MRLNPFQLKTICDNAEKYFGSQVHLWLFDSRVDDHKKGGDIDLYIESTIQDVALLVDAKLDFLRALHRLLGEQKIDVVLNRLHSKKTLPIFQIAKETGVRLR